MGILDWIEEKARKKMRFSHIKILYQNIFAAEFLIQALGDKAEVPSSQENILAVQERTKALIVEIPDVDMLDDASSEKLFEDNRTLKKMYAALSLEPDAAAEPAKTIDFVERFKPAAGWKSFSDADWKGVVNKQLNAK